MWIEISYDNYLVHLLPQKYDSLVVKNSQYTIHSDNPNI